MLPSLSHHQNISIYLLLSPRLQSMSPFPNFLLTDSQHLFPLWPQFIPFFFIIHHCDLIISIYLFSPTNMTSSRSSSVQGVTYLGVGGQRWLGGSGWVIFSDDSVLRNHFRQGSRDQKCCHGLNLGQLHAKASTYSPVLSHRPFHSKSVLSLHFEFGGGGLGHT